MERTCLPVTGHVAKVLVGINPQGAIVFSSLAYPGKISDVDICRPLLALELLSENDVALVDKGFLVHHLFAMFGIQTLMPPKKRSDQLTYAKPQAVLISKVANKRVHVVLSFLCVLVWCHQSCNRAPNIHTHRHTRCERTRRVGVCVCVCVCVGVCVLGACHEKDQGVCISQSHFAVGPSRLSVSCRVCDLGSQQLSVCSPRLRRAGSRPQQRGGYR